ncbi:YdcF family protein [Nesterenkonia flava]|uniref:YdcF family protein n=1 Tax=Nesterenkonia flava TaxID=469799 RepID=A0ABU1FWU1_9MICC|nr:YdcF family protein [Nesterenkonia flava]MDR5712717.1 YdcF family protein [Nesterenkonia flava]
MILLLGAILCLTLYFWFRSRDRRMLRNGVMLVLGILLGVAGLLNVLWDQVPALDWILAKAIVAALLGILILGLLLIANGFVVVRREGRSLANLLSPLAGLALFASPLAVINLLNANTAVTVPLAVLIFFGVGYLGVVFLIFLTYAVIYSRDTHKVAPTAIVILGAQLINGKAGPLLRSRLDRALQVYRQTDALRPVLIPSGGQGPDESRPEGEGMAEYLLERGAAPNDVLIEDRSTNTAQNLLFSQQVRETLPLDDPRRTGPMLVSTSNYHVLRAALLARRLRLDAEVVGARTAWYYVPSAFLREYIAVLKEHVRLHAVLFAPFVALSIYFVVLYLD